MSPLPTQAQITRAVKAAIRGAHEMKLGVTGFTVTFSQGVPSVAVTCAPDSGQPSPVETGGPNVEHLKTQLASRHAARRS